MQAPRNRILLACLMLLLAPVLGRAEDYPSRPIRLIITTPAGSLVDGSAGCSRRSLPSGSGSPS